MVSDLTVRILEEIRDAVRDTNVRLDRYAEMTDRRFETIDRRFESMDRRFESIENRIVEGEIRLATAITEMSGKLDEVKEVMRGRRELTTRVERCEEDIRLLKDRTGCP